ncbi:MAG: hypothetical protein MJ211_15720, partial [Bacteroidales bacterium]|nr:hypothetical protein [Bacteroidales bacterium]
MIKVFNPIYDSVFKYLMENDRVSKIILGSILNKKIENIELKNNDHVITYQNGIKVLRHRLWSNISRKRERVRICNKDRFGIKLKLSKDNILTFTGTQKPDTNYIYAYDNLGKRIGKLFVYTYKRQTKNVVLVSVNNAKIDKSITVDGLNKIFKPAVTEFIISEDKIEIPDLKNFTHGGSNWHSVYNSDQKLVLEAYDKNIKDDNFYLFFIDNVLDKK